MAATDSADAKAPVEINVADFSNLIAGMSRLLVGLAAIAPFKDAQLGLAEWVTLSVLSEKDGVSNKQLGRNLGVTGQRANQICNSLSEAGLISVIQSAEDNRRNEIKITDAGKQRFRALNDQLQPLLAGALQNKERVLVSANRQIKTLMRVVNMATPEKVTSEAADGKNKAKAKRRAAKAGES